ncbi:Tuberous sclerosis 2-like protein [Coniosporium apollinis]|uniref:Tuberous sclerosis 2-like protein n=1 Tax=Coniosporium apollinis TaxID=61459 RepID=A0ABQ9NSL0_9PEZI|nr:Tuberous sclerosis 2-like protein [Coniosporium apollinis]
MSPTPSDVPQTPERRSSSSALFGAFNRLTGGRIKTPAISAAVITPAPPKLVRHESSSRLKTIARNNHIEVTEGHAESNAELAVVRTAVPSSFGDVLGGPPELGPLLQQLHPDRSIAERIEAIDRICPILEAYPVTNVLAIWTTAQDLADREGDADATRAVYRLLKSCVQLPDLSSVERSAFFKAVAANQSDADFDIRFEILLALTNNGRNVEAFEALPSNTLAKSLWRRFKIVADARKAKKKSKADVDVDALEKGLARLFQYVVDVAKFNARLFQEHDVEFLLEVSNSICRQTVSEADIINCVNVFNALITYTQIPKRSLKSCLETLCDVYRQMRSCRKQTWAALSHLFTSHMGQSAVVVLLSVLSEEPHAEKPRRNIVRGVIHAMQSLLLANGADNLPKVSLSLLLPALKPPLLMRYHKIEAEILQLLTLILRDAELSLLLLEGHDWTAFVEIVDECARALSVKEPSEKELQPGVMPLDTSLMLASTNDGDPVNPLGDLAQIIQDLDALIPTMDFIQKAAVMDLFKRLGKQLNETIASRLINYYVEERLLHPSNDGWLVACRDLLTVFFKDEERTPQFRILVLNTLIDAYVAVEGVSQTSTVTEFAIMILESIPNEDDSKVLEILCNFALTVARWAPAPLFDRILEFFRSVLLRRTNTSTESPASSYWSPSSSRAPTEQQDLGSPSNVLTLGLVRLFIRTVSVSAYKAQKVFELLLRVAKSDCCATDARISALKLLFRLRSDANQAILVTPSSEGESIAAVLCRTVETAAGNYSGEDYGQHRQSRADDQSSQRDSRAASAVSPHASFAKPVHRVISGPIKASRPVPPVWMYGGARGLPEEPYATASPFLYSHLELPDNDPSNTREELNIGLWIDFLISILQHGADWEVYSYVLVHLGAQLTNQSLFKGVIPAIRMLRNLLCDQIKTASFHEPPAFTSLKKADVAVCLFHILTMLISYNPHFDKSEEDDMVRTFHLGIGSWDRTSKWCIHALTVCCHELPLSTSKCLDGIMQKMSQIVTQSQNAIHILEFLAGLSRMPDLYKNFREDDFKMVFGVCFRYLQSVRDQRERASNQTFSQHAQGSLRHSGPSRDLAAASKHDSKISTKSATEDLPQYVHALAFHVIVFWFMSLKLQDRQKYKDWIAKNLTYTDSAGREIVDDYSLVTIDLMYRVAWSDRDETAADTEFAKPSDGEVRAKSWVIGLSLVTVETAARTGVSHITHRRPTSTKYSIYRPLLTDPPRHQVPLTTGLAAEEFYKSTYVGILPDAILQELYSSQSFASTYGAATQPPIPLPDDEQTRRAMTMFDHIPTVDGHKVGVLFIGDGQKTEAEVFANVMGSSDYTAFISDLGSLMRLKNAKFNTQGLDRQNNDDGEFTYCWRDRVTEIVFHIPTMMPTEPDTEFLIRKKSHIGNDYVNIIFNNSGIPFNFNMFPSAFNYVYIVITPEARASFVETRSASYDGKDLFYKVQVMVAPGFPEISPAAEPKIINGKSLPNYVRLIALNASVFSLVWQNRANGEYPSSWCARLRQIRRLKERHESQQGPPQVISLPPSGGGGQIASGPPAVTSPGTRESGGVFKRTSIATFVSEATSRSSTLSGSTETEKQASDHSRG